jgi:hypothetical protein
MNSEIPNIVGNVHDMRKATVSIPGKPMKLKKYI